MNLAAEQVPLLEVKEKRNCGLGSIKVLRQNESIVLPLARVEINASVKNQVAEVTHEQTFQNPFSEHLEATYIFPLPGGGAVSHFEMKVGEKIITGKVKEREEARREYTKAVSEGKKAALLEQERDDVFTVQVGNIPPSKEIKVKITYSEKLTFFENGTSEIRLPLVVAPRYIAGDTLERNQSGRGVDPDTDIVPDASRITPPRLAEGFDPKIDLVIGVEIFQSNENEAQSVSELTCSQHATKTAIGNGIIKVKLATTNELLNRDFILRWQMAQADLKNDLTFYKEQQGEVYGMLTLIPPKREGFFGLGRDIVFVLDRSGSMEGIKMTSAAKACSVLLDTLGPNDRFSILAFDDQLEWFNPDNITNDSSLFLKASETGIEKGKNFLWQIGARGGTELDYAVGSALTEIKQRKEIKERVPVIVVLTDGQIGDESRVLKRIQKEVGDARIFTVGIDTAVNENFLKRLAVLGGGTSAFVVPGEELETALAMIGREIGTPVLIDIKIKDENCGIIADSPAPEKAPDLFAGRTVNIFFKAKNTGSIIVSGKFYEGGDFYAVVSGIEVRLPAISQLWAKTKVFYLEDEFRVCEAAFDSGQDKNKLKIKQEIISLSVKHSILTRFTAFIAVDESEITNNDGDLRKVIQPVEQPAKWEMHKKRMAAPPVSLSPAPSPFYTNAISPAAEQFTGGNSVSQNSGMYRMQPAMAPPAGAPGNMSPSVGLTGGGGNTGKLNEMQAQLTEGSNKVADSSWLGNKLIQIKEKVLSGKDKKQDIVIEKVETEKQLWEAIELFIRAFESLVQQVKAGIVPDVAEFEKSRISLMEILSESESALQLTKLQRFLRNESVEIIASLKADGIRAENLTKQFVKYQKSIDDIKVEAARIDPEPGNFWEGSI